MQQSNNFKSLQKDLEQEAKFKKFKTIVIDIENTIVTKIEIKNLSELKQII